MRQDVEIVDWGNVGHGGDINLLPLQLLPTVYLPFVRDCERDRTVRHPRSSRSDRVQAWIARRLQTQNGNSLVSGFNVHC